MSSPVLWGPGYANNLQPTELLANGNMLSSNGARNYLPQSSYKLGTTTWTAGTIGTLTNGIPSYSLTGGGTAPTFGSGAAGTFGVVSVSTGVLNPSLGPNMIGILATATTTVGNMIASPVFTIDPADQAKILQFKHAYSVGSGATGMNFSGTSANSYGVAIWDVTNSKWADGQSSNFGFTQNAGTGYLSGTFQTAINASQFRYVIYCVTATTVATTSIAFDDFYVGPQTVVGGPVITDWVPYTPTFTGLGTPTSVSAKSRRVGDTLQVSANFATGTTTATSATMSLGYNGANANVSTDLTKITAGTVIGTTATSASSSTIFGYSVLAPTSAGGGVLFGVQSSTSAPTTGQNGNALWGSGILVEIEFFVPIVGWSSNVQMSSDTDTRVVAARISTSGTGVVFNTSQPIGIYPTVEADTHGAYNASTGVYTIPVSGWYQFDAQVFVNTTSYAAGGSIQLGLYRNGTGIGCIAQTRTTNTAAYTTAPEMSGSTKFLLSAGDAITFRGYSDTATTTIAGSPTNNNITIARVSGPSIIAATETVVASYVLTPATAVASNAIVKFDTKLKDSHNAYNTTTGVFTVPISGQYRVSGVGQNSVTGTSFYLALSSGNGLYMNAMPNAGVGGGSVSIPLLAGQTVSVKLDIGGTLTGVVSGNYVTSFSIERTGN